MTRRSFAALILMGALIQGTALSAAITISLSTGVTDIFTGGQLVLIPTVIGALDTSVQWSLSPNVGSITNLGVYTAPSSLNQDTTVTITATSQADPSKTASSQVNIHANGIYFTTNLNGLQSVVFQGTDYNYVYGEGLLTSVSIVPPNGSSKAFTPACSGTFTPTSVTKICTAGGDSFTLTVSYSVPSYGTVQAQISFTNNSLTNTVSSALISTLGVKTTQYDPNDYVPGLSETSALSYLNFVSGRVAIWNNAPGPNVSFNQSLGSAYVWKNQPQLENVAPGQTATATFSLRFNTDLTLTRLALAPEAYAAYQAAYPYIVNWPDRRPIFAWFMSDHSHQTPGNPRGYFNDITLDISDVAGFRAQALALAQSVLTSIKARPVQPQGILLWDLEGQEFVQSTTYIGDPRILSQGYAAEMDAAADQVFALFKNAGLKVGVALRPQYMQWGPLANRPLACNFDPLNDYKDYYIAVDSAYLNRFFGCYAPNTWSLVPAGNGSQTIFQPTQVQQVTDLLLAKVKYAHDGWGATLYYVDSAVFEGGTAIPASIFRALQLAYPDSLFMPEQSYMGTLAATIPYATPGGSLNSPFAPETWRYAYPNGAQVTNMSNCTGACWTSDVASFDIGQKIGDIAMYSIPQQLSPTQLGNIETMILQARSEAGIVNVTDSSTGLIYAFSGTPATVFQYPLKMRVYFSDSAANIAGSTTYCENGGFAGTNSCTLNLAGLITSQIRYYDFGGGLVQSLPTQTTQPGQPTQATQITQMITFGTLSNVTFGVAPFTLTATALSGLTVAYTSNTPTVCGVANATVTILGAGSCSITATQPGNANYAPAPSITQNFTVNQALQAITFSLSGSIPFAPTPLSLTATASSTLSVAFSSSTQAVCITSGAALTFVGPGTCTITASQPGNANYLAAISVPQSFTVVQGAQTQTISFAALSNLTFGAAPFSLTAIASSGLPVTLTSTTPAVCTLLARTLTIVGTGTCSITASQLGTVSYLAAVSVSRSFNVAQGTQSIAFGALSNVTFGPGTLSLTAITSSGLTVNLASTTQTVCTLAGTTVTLVNVGTCSITASQSGTQNYAAAASVIQSFSITRASQTITFPALSNIPFAPGPRALTATASSGLIVGFASTTQSICTVSGTTLTLVKVGVCSITAAQSGGPSYTAASSVGQSFTIAKGVNTITFATPGAGTMPASPFTLTATAASGLAITFASTTTTICTVSGVTLTPVTVGACSVTASQAGNTNYASATPVSRSFTIKTRR